MYPRRWSALLACLAPFALVISHANAGGVTGRWGTRHCLRNARGHPLDVMDSRDAS
jgi:hypothetical protein